MKKALTFLLTFALTISITACGSEQNSASQAESSISTENTEISTTEPIQTQAAAPTKLTNTMTELELQWVDKHELTLLDEIEKPNADPQAEHKVSIEFMTYDPQERLSYIEEHRDELVNEEYAHMMQRIQTAEETGSEYRFPLYILVDGYRLPLLVPDEYDFYNGASYPFVMSEMDENGEITPITYTFDSFEEYLEFIQEQGEELLGYSDEEITIITLYMQIAHDALLNGTYETLPEGSVDPNDPKAELLAAFHNYRSDWEYDRDEVEAIRDSVDEISIYDEELAKQFTVHVTLPPDYDRNQTYPVFFLTDGIWRFGNCPALRKCMENGEAAPVILVSLYYSYDVTDPGQDMRYCDLVINREELLNFITDNLMPYLCENYNIDCGNSTLYGHSDGGVFTHYALFNSDKFENQPFGHYIIGSPALWGLKHYNEYEGISNDIYQNDYGYFDRNETLSKTVFLCAGSLEDPDYAENYREGDDTTLEGVAKLKERLESHGADLTYQLYESHHYQYIPEMLVEFLKQTYPG